MDYKKLGSRVKKARLKLNLNQNNLAEKVGLSTVHISHIETGASKMSIDALIRISDALQVTPDFLLYDSFFNSKEYLNEEIALLLQQCDEKDTRLIIELIKAVIKSRE
ncbi:MAG: helix-turn-helix domain-containing protein [Syntrophomonadaceae bacterium]|jgi:transcriptional regulator with XRE-family HTH domain|nr:helix-turn-helix domain-containing protein [Syntrophomonadaceae bacterium]